MTTKWYLNLFPNGKTEESKSNVGIYLHCKNANETGFDFKARFKLGVHKDNGEDCFVVSRAEAIRSKEHLKEDGWGHSIFLTHEELFNEENGFVAGGKLVVFVELTVEVEIAKPPPKIARSLCSDFKKMFKNKAFRDFQLKTNDDKVLKAHKVVLVARSPVFFAMLTTALKEPKYDTTKDSANDPDFDSKVMREVLRFIYYNEVKSLSEIAPQLVLAAEKYQLEELKEICLKEIAVEVELVKTSPKISRSSNPLADYKKMFENDVLTDFQLKSSDNEVFKAHKAILAARSPMFYAMLATNMEEGKQDFDSKVMREVLRFIYYNEVKSLSEIAPQLVLAAEKYQLEDLKDICLKEITSSIKVGNAVKFLKIANQVSDAEELFEKCLDLIVDNYSEVSQGSSWRKLTKKLLFKIIDSMNERCNTLRI